MYRLDCTEEIGWSCNAIETADFSASTVSIALNVKLATMKHETLKGEKLAEEREFVRKIKCFAKRYIFQECAHKQGVVQS